MPGKIRGLLIACLCAVVLCAAGLLLCFPGCQSPEQAYAEFVRPDRECAEDQMMDPLILAGECVVPIVLRHVENPDMPRRRYAIHFLGNVGSRDALPILERLLWDSSERDYIRGDALQAIAMIDLQRGQSLARECAKGDGYLAYIAREVLAEDKQLLEKRSYDDALNERHD